MTKQPNKPRILYLIKILYEHTNEESGLSLPQIQMKLEEYGISCERKALYRDISALNEFGFKIGKISARPVQYYFANRLFTHSELLLLIDAVQSSRSITQTNSQDLIAKLKRLVSISEAQDIQSQIHVIGRIKMQNDSIFITLDQIQKAIAQKRDISFNYTRHDINMQTVNTTGSEGALRIKTPLFLIYTDEKYYLGVFDENTHDNIKTYRVDRMSNVLILENSATSHKMPPDFDIAQYERRTPGMFDSEPIRVTLHVPEHLVSNIIDLFGTEDTTSIALDTTAADKVVTAVTDTAVTDTATNTAGANTEATNTADTSSNTGNANTTWAEMTVKVAPSPVFFGQIAQFAGDVRIVKPSKVVNDYNEHIAKIVQTQKLYE